MYFVPYGTKMFRYDLFRITNTKAIATIHEGTFNEGFFDLVLYADSVHGLQIVGPDGAWHDVVPSPGNLLVNLGDPAEVATRLRALTR